MTNFTSKNSIWRLLVILNCIRLVRVQNINMTPGHIKLYTPDLSVSSERTSRNRRPPIPNNT